MDTRSDERKCFVTGSLGLCGPDCEVYLDGDCPEHSTVFNLEPKESEGE